MNILWLAHRDPLNPNAGGAEKIIYEVGKRLVSAGDKVTIFSGGWRNCTKKENLDGINIVRFGRSFEPHLVAPIHILTGRYDIVIADLGHAVPWISPIILRKRTIVSFLHLHARSLPGQVGKILTHVITSIEKLYFIFYGRQNFVTISNTSYSDLIELGINENRITVINPGVNSDIFKPRLKTECPSLIYFGGMRPYKRPEVTLFLLKELKTKISNIKLTIIGDGPSRCQIERLCDKLGLKENVVITGRASDSEVAEIVASSWLNIHSSVTEGWGISIIEAASAGTPTVAYKVPGVCDSLKDGYNGITVENGNLKALIDASLIILKNPEKWWSSSIEVAKKYSWDKTADLWKKLIVKISM